jgi:hypothetical protein
MRYPRKPAPRPSRRRRNRHLGHTKKSTTTSAKRSIGCCVNDRTSRPDKTCARIAAPILGLALAVAGPACKHPAPAFDPQAAARTILSECASDSSCVRERWRRDPRDWGIGLRAEVAGRDPESPFVVETTREIASPELSAGACAVTPVGAAVDYRTWVTRRRSGEFALALFRWDSYEQALVGHRQIVALVSKARGDEEAMWQALSADAAVDATCLHFRGHRDRCAEGG